ncbi:MAG TPA: M10 family metallopeptidase, partial [Ramlibacter sp.]|nr:M10 family metallopeptidase [Ramlibacter sp.]
MATQTNSVPGTGYGSAYIDSLVWGCGWEGGPVSYYFGSGSVAADDSSLDGGAFTGASWLDAEKEAFETALDQFAEVCNLVFEEAATQADANIVWWLAPNSEIGSGILGMHEVPDESYSQIYGYFNYQHSSWANLTPGSYGYITVIHELGHGMGLAHPHDGGDHSDASLFPGVRSPSSLGTSGLNQGIWTTMSYNDGWSLAPSPSMAYGYQGALMALDVAALQALYGANMTVRTGDNSYALPQVNASGTGWSCIWDAGGTDTISNAGSAIACTINLNAAPLTGSAAGGYVSRDAGIYGGYTIANGVVIENATGGSGNDVLVGNVAANVLDGG